MDSEEDNAFLMNYKRLAQESGSRINVQRKRTSQIHKFSLQSLDEHSTCYLLERNLSKLNEIVCTDTDQTVASRNARIQAILNTKKVQTDPDKLKSNLENIDLRSLIKPLPCVKDSSYLTCSKSESISKHEFQQFKAALNQIKPSFPEFKEKKLAKCFAPRSCQNSKDIKLLTNFPEETKLPSVSAFKTAREEFNVQSSNRKYGNNSSGSVSSNSSASVNNVGLKRKLGIRRNINSKFVSPLLSANSSEEMSTNKSEEWPCSEVDERLKNIDVKMVELIRSEIMDVASSITWNDIAGLDFAKTAIQEAVVWPMLRPDIFTGLRRPPKGILLFGPPGTGKTLIGKCVASQSKSTFFSISASSLTSKWVGDGEKMVRALFAVARVHQPSVIFIDEIDSLLSQRNESEHESSRRIKTEFLVQLDGATTDNEERLLVIGATNRPQELDEAARRRFVKRLYIPLPEIDARLQLVTRLIANERHELSVDNFQEVAKQSEGYSGADIRNLCSEASLGPIRALDMNRIESIQAAEVRPLKMEDFNKAFTRVRSSVSPNDLNQYIVWDQTYGSGF